LRNKVLFDSCVIVAASVFVSAKDDIGIELKHNFYEQSIALESLARKYLAKRIGIVTRTIETEALGVLSRRDQQAFWSYLRLARSSSERSIKEP